MEYRTLGCTGLKVSAIGIGTWQLSGPLTLEGKADGFPDLGEATVVDLVHACGDLGINFIDSAEIYGDGEGERRAGKAIRGRRDKWIVSTKFGIRRGNAGGRVRDVRPEAIRSSLERSLKRLQTDYLDIYLYHSSPDIERIAEGKDVLDGLKREGKVRTYGISTNDDKLLLRLVNYNAVETVMFSHSLVTHSAVLLELMKKYNLGGIVRGALESGRLSGQYFHRNPQFNHDDIRGHLFRSLDTRKYAFYERLLPANVHMATFALRYVLDFNTTHTIVLGGRSLQQYRDAIKAFDIPRLDGNTQKALELARRNIWKTSVTRKIVERLKRVWA